MTLKQTIIAAVVVVAGFTLIARIGERRGAAKSDLKQGQEQTKTGEKELARQNVIYKTDTIRLTRERVKLRELRDTLRITDTVAVIRYIAQADSTIKACSLALITCEQKDSAHKVIEAGLRRQNEALKKLLPTRTEKVVTAAKWLLVGAAVGVVINHK
jgi:hypothetical protein